jgi:hypothetical protein
MWFPVPVRIASIPANTVRDDRRDGSRGEGGGYIDCQVRLRGAVVMLCAFYCAACPLSARLALAFSALRGFRINRQQVQPWLRANVVDITAPAVVDIERF